MDRKKTKKENDKLDKEIIEKIRKDLLARKKQITEDLKEIVDKQDNKSIRHKVKFPDFGSKTDENAQEIGEYSTNLVTDKVLENALRDINNALERIENKTYGICKYCKKPIGKKRLLARPVASTCVECKTKLQSAA
jgi:RNA polymerase-binding protein DksA